MTRQSQFEIFLGTAPGLEAMLHDEVRLKGFKQPKPVAGGVVFKGGWPEVWRANLWLRGANRVLARVESFRVEHLGQLESRARHVPWGEWLRPDVPFRVEATCAKSRIYHSGAAAERIGNAIRQTVGAPQDDLADVTVMVRIEHDLCTLSLDTSGDLLHKRGFKEAVNKAPMRETMASLFLRQCGYDGSEPVYDPMCGSGTFVIEAAEIAARLNPGRARSFAFEQLATFDPEAWQKMRDVKSARTPTARFYGSDRDAGAIRISQENAERAGVAEWASFATGSVGDAVPPCETPGLVMVNPPYGARLGDAHKLYPLYASLGQVLKTRFHGWRVGIITTEAALAYATGLSFLPITAPVQHGGLRVTLFQTEALAG